MTCKIYNTDCTTGVPEVAEFGGKFDLVFGDPPFNISQPYENYNDNRDDFEKFTFDWVLACWESCDGVLALHGPDDLADLYLQAGAKFNMPRIAWVNWHYRFGQNHRRNWIDSRCHCLIFARSEWIDRTEAEYGKGVRILNRDELLVDSDRKTTYSDPRINDTERGGQRLPFTIWGIPSDGPNWGRVQGNNGERYPQRPNQLPELYMARLIKGYSNEGDRLADAFSGTGTFSVVADALGRNCSAFDVDPAACQVTHDRLIKGAIRI